MIFPVNHLQPSNGSDELLRSKWELIEKILKNKEMDTKAKQQEISKIVSPVFDFPVMAKLSLGRKNWPKLTKPQQEKFTELFIKLLKDSYGGKIAAYSDEEVVFKPSIKKKKTIHIPIDMISKEKKFAMIYKLRKVEKSWKIYDVEIEGVSFLLTYRSQFDDILSRGTVEDLLSRLEKPEAD
jgi:phospholipid transport system substrate-binding protein